jgi:hypothetical protein
MQELAVTENLRAGADFEAPEGVDELTGTTPRNTFELAANQSVDIASEIRSQIKFLRYIRSGGPLRRSGRG